MNHEPAFFNYIQRVRRKIMRDGIFNTFAQACLRVESLFFDFKYGVDTHRIVLLRDLDNYGIRYGHQYQPIAVKHLRRILKEIEFKANDVFVDFGCGKGRVLLIASELKLAKVVGVEISEELCNIARKNVVKFRPRQRQCAIEVHCNDAVAYEIKDEQTVFFFFNPFCRKRMQKVVGNIETSWVRGPRKIRLIFLNFRAETLVWEPNLFELMSASQLNGLPLQIYQADPKLQNK